MVNEDPATDKDSGMGGPSRQPTRTQVTSALNLFVWIEQFAVGHGVDNLDQSELDELWNAVDTALGLIGEGEVGYRRMMDLLERVDLARGSGGSLDFDVAARFVGPVIARLRSEVENLAVAL